MKKKITSLMLKKKSISNLQGGQLSVGFEKATRKCYMTVNELCETDSYCPSHEYQTCTVTYEFCFTELRFCGTEC